MEDSKTRNGVEERKTARMKSVMIPEIDYDGVIFLVDFKRREVMPPKDT